MPLWKTRRLQAGFSGDWVAGSVLAAEVPVTGNGQFPFELAAIAQRAKPERKRSTINERFAAIIMFIRKAGFEAHCRNCNRRGKPFFGLNIAFFGGSSRLRSRFILENKTWQHGPCAVTLVSREKRSLRLRQLWDAETAGEFPETLVRRM
jgi:hypothetical protein